MANEFRVLLTAKATKEMLALHPEVQRVMRRKIERLQTGLVGDVKRLSDFSPAYRLRVGDYRVLFDVNEDRIIISVIGHRRDVYDR